MSGFDPKDSTSTQRNDAWLENVPNQGLGETQSGLKIGLPIEYLSGLEDTSGVEHVRKALESKGHTFTEVSLPHTDAAIPAYYVIAGAEASTNLSRYDGVRFGHRCKDPTSLEDLYKRSRSEGFGDEVKRRILTGTYALSVGYYDAYYLKAQQIRRLISNDFNEVFKTVDVLLTPDHAGTGLRRRRVDTRPCRHVPTRQIHRTGKFGWATRPFGALRHAAGASNRCPADWTRL